MAESSYVGSLSSIILILCLGYMIPTHLNSTPQEFPLDGVAQSYASHPTVEQLVMNLNGGYSFHNGTLLYILQDNSNTLRLSFFESKSHGFANGKWGKWEYVAYIQSELLVKGENMSLYAVQDHRCGEAHFQTLYDGFLWQVLRNIQQSKLGERVIWRMRNRYQVHNMKDHGFRLFDSLSSDEQDKLKDPAFEEHINYNFADWQDWFFVSQ